MDERQTRLAIMREIVSEKYPYCCPVRLADGRIASTDGHIIVALPRFDLPDVIPDATDPVFSATMAEKIAPFLNADDARYEPLRRVRADELEEWSGGVGPVWDYVERDPEIEISEEPLRIADGAEWSQPIRHGDLYGFAVDRCLIARALRAFGCHFGPYLLDLSLPVSENHPMRLRLGERVAFIMGVKLGPRPLHTFWAFEEAIKR